MRGHRIYARETCPHPAERIAADDGVCTACGTPDAKPVSSGGRSCGCLSSSATCSTCWPDTKPVRPCPATGGRAGCNLSTEDTGCCEAPGGAHHEEYSSGPIDYPGAKPVDSVEVSAQVVEEELCAQAPYADANPVDPDGVDDGEPDAKPVDPPEDLGEFVQRALGIAITQPIAAPSTISESIKRAADRVASMPYQPWTPPVVSPRDAPAAAAELAAIYGLAPVVEQSLGPIEVSWEKGPEPIVRGVPQDPGPGPFPSSLTGRTDQSPWVPLPDRLRPRTPQGGPAVIGVPWAHEIEAIAHVLPGGGLYETNSFVIRAEAVPPSAERQAELDRQAAARKAKARRRGARQVARVARQRARGIRPCTHDCDRNDW